MHIPSWTLCLTLAALLCGPGCRFADVNNTNHRTWMAAETNPALQAGVTLRGWFYSNIFPRMGEYYVVNRDGSFVRTHAELKKVIQPIDTLERALAYRSLLRRIELVRDQDLTALLQTTPLEFHNGETSFWGVFVATDAARWGVGQEQIIKTTGDGVSITQPSFRQAGGHDAGDANWYAAGATVELVRETIGRDGGYRREVLRVLERGEAALVHKPALLR